MNNLSGVRESLSQRGYTAVPIDVHKPEMEAAMDKYTAFLELDEPYHEATRFLLGNRGDGDFGQFARRAGNTGERGKVQDNKDIFHFGSMTRQVVESRLSGPLPAEMRDFLDSAEAIYWSAERSKRRGIEELDIAGAGLLSVMQPKTEMLNDVLRFIAYYPNEGALAKGHFDRSAATVAIGESHEGLRMAPGQNARYHEVNKTYMDGLQNSLQPVSHVDGEAKFFLGAGWNRLGANYRRGNESMPLAWHDVVSSPKSVNDKVARWAIVMFANPHWGYEQYVVPSPTETRPYKGLEAALV